MGVVVVVVAAGTERRFTQTASSCSRGHEGGRVGRDANQSACQKKDRLGATRVWCRTEAAKCAEAECWSRQWHAEQSAAACAMRHAW